MAKFLISFLWLATQVVCYGQSYSIVFLNKKANQEQLPKEQLEKIMEGHMADLNKLHQEGKLLVAGPFAGGGGFFILNTTSTDEANTWLQGDPGVQAKRWNIEILPYQPRYGSVCSVVEPYEIVSYQFIRYDAMVSKSTANEYPRIIKKHNDYLKKLTHTGNVITEAIFGDHDGGILIIKGELEKELIEADAGVQEGLLDYQIKTLYIAKGSFREK